MFFLKNIHFQKKEEQEKEFKLKKVKTKQAKRVVVAICCLTIACSVLALIRSITLQQTIQRLEQHIGLSSPVSQQEDVFFIDEFSLQDYIKRFLLVYFNISSIEAENKQRLDYLKLYFAKNVAIPTDEFRGIARKLLNWSIVRYERINQDELLVYVSVQYETTVPNVENSTKNVYSALELRIHVENGLFTLLHYPVFTAVPSNFGTENGKKVMYSEQQQVKEQSILTEINSFLTLFYNKYASGKKEELSYLMKEPQGLNGAFRYQQVKDVVVYEIEKGVYKVYSKVYFAEKESDFVHVEPFILTIEKQLDKLVVQKIERY